MFEKEAEEIANKRCHEIMCYGHCSFSSPKHHRCGEWHREYECALKGAEFGYNMATNKSRSIVHRLLVLIQNHKWWNYTVIDEARAFMSEVDRDKDND